jgi:hypothetical protein
MQTRTTASTGWDDDDDDFEPECVTMVEDGFERGAALRGLWLHVRSQAFRSARVTAVLSGLTVDLREAALSPEGATIDCNRRSAASRSSCRPIGTWPATSMPFGAAWATIGEA